MYGDKRVAMQLPPAYQVLAPFGVNVGGINPAYLKYSRQANYDSWLDLGVTTGDSSNLLGVSSNAQQHNNAHPTMHTYVYVCMLS